MVVVFVFVWEYIGSSILGLEVCLGIKNFFRIGDL